MNSRHLTIALGAVLSACLCASAIAEPGITRENQRILQSELQDLLQEVIAQQPPLPGQTSRRITSVTVNIEEQLIYVDLAEGYLPQGPASNETYGAIVQLEAAARKLMHGIVSSQGVRFRIGGKNLHTYIPGYASPEIAL